MQAEVIGPGIQQNEYGLKEVSLRVFSVLDVGSYRLFDHAMSLEEVRGLKDKKDYEKTATWHESYARKINQISTRGVDPAAVAFATGAAERLRAIAGSLRGVPIDATALASGAYALASVSTYGRGFGWRGGRDYNLDTNIPQTKAAIAKVVAQDEKTRLHIWSEIQNSTVSTRQKLNDSYGGGF